MHTLAYLTAGLLTIGLLNNTWKKESLLTLEEVCDNARDDDADGLIDLNDPDCNCIVAEPVSLIPNPSFEENTCCPQTRGELYCAETWIQASEATTDYIHTCGWMGWDSLPVPLPIPDGDACIGFRNGRFGPDGDNEPGWKEYAGACLTAPLKARNTYKFEFNIGFTYYDNSPPTEVVFFGTSDCSNLPFGLGDSGYGCPTNGEGWRKLGSTNAVGSRNWAKRQITITPDEDIYAIAIGPNCRDLMADDDIYYFFDNLILADEKAFEFRIGNVNHPCSPDFRLNVPTYEDLDYQWYKDGIALIGETDTELEVKGREGDYQVRIVGDGLCWVTPVYNYQTPVLYQEVNQIICPGDEFAMNGQVRKQAGVYLDTLQNVNGCDSIVQINLEMAEHTADTVVTKIFEGETYYVGDRIRYKKPGQYVASLNTEYGCDSLIYLDLDFYELYIPNAFSPDDDGMNDTFSVFGGSDLQTVQFMRVFDRWGAMLYDWQGGSIGESESGWDGTFRNKKSPSGVYMYEVGVLMDDGKERQIKGAVTLVR